MSRRRLRLAALAASAALIAAGGAASAATATGSTFNYASSSKTALLSQPTFTDIARTSYDVPMNGTTIHIEVVRPTAPGRYPVILEASPYHGTAADRDGTRILPFPKVGGVSIGLTGFFAPRGYAVAYMDLRGTGKSGGCLDHLGPNDGKDLKSTVEWLADQQWSTGRVGMTGHSYVGSTPMAAAAQNPRGLITIVPSAGLASMYDHQFQAGVPYNLQYIGPTVAYESLSMWRELPSQVPTASLPAVGGESGDDFGRHPTEFGCGLPNSAAFAGSGQVTGQYEAWHAARNSSAGATAWNGTAFLVHGVNDNAARITAAQWFFNRQGRAGDKAWIGQWDHGSGYAPNRRGMQWDWALLAWFDKQLKQLDVDTGPATEVFMVDAASQSSAITGGTRREVLVGDGFPTVADSTLDLYTGAGGTLTGTKGAAGTVSFTGTSREQVGSKDAPSTEGVYFRSPALTEDVVLAGMPTLDLAAGVTVPQVHLIATVYDQSPNGALRRIGQFAINPLLRDGVATISPVVPGTIYQLKPPGFAMAQHVLAGHKITLRVNTSDPDKVGTTATDPNVTVAFGQGGTALHLPVVSNATLLKDSLDVSGS